MSKKSLVVEKVIIFAVFLVFAGIVVSFSFGWSIVDNQNNNENVNSFQFKTSSKSESAIVDSSLESKSDTNSDSGLININSAPIDKLMTLPGIGEKKAQAIIDYRENIAPFGTIEDIKEVSGIGDTIFDNLKELITVE